MQSVPRPQPAYLPVVLLLILLVFPVFAGNTNIYDQQAHRDFAQIWQRDGQPVTPHFGYHLILLAVNSTIPKGNLEASEIAVNMAAYVIAGVLFFRYAFGQLYEVAPAMAAGLATGLTGLMVLAGPPVMLSWLTDFQINSYIIYNQFHNPTQNVVLPMAIGLYALTLRLLMTGRLSWLGLAGLATLALITPLTKPNFSLVLLPALVLIMGWRFVRREAVPWRALLLTVFVPTMLALGWQFYFTYVQQTVIGYGLNASNGILFAPFKTALYFDPSLLVVGLKLLASLALPLWVIAFYPEARRHVPLLIGWLLVGIGLAQYLLLSEAGEFYTAANFSWGLRTVSFFVFGMSLIHLIRADLHQRRRDTRFKVGVLLLLLHVVGGATLYYGYASSVSFK